MPNRNRIDTMSWDRKNLEQLVEETIEGRLSSERYHELKTLLLTDRTALDFYIDHVQVHNSLAFQACPGFMAPEEMRILLEMTPPDVFPPILRKSVPDQTVSPPIDRRFSWKNYRLAWSATFTLLLGIAVLAGVFLLRRPSDDDVAASRNRFAEIVKTTNCSWGDSTTSTQPGTRIGCGRLHLKQGIASIRFDCKVDVTLEGPCVFEVRGEKSTLLHSGRMIVSVESPDGYGFVVDAPDATVTDYGTRFGIHAPPNRPTTVYVIDGNVEVQPKNARQPLSLLKGESVVFEKGEISSASEQEKTAAAPSEIAAIQFSTLTGRAKEAWVVAETKTLHKTKEVFPRGVSDPYMLVKSSLPGDFESDRKAIFSIDISSLENKEAVSGAVLHLAHGPTDIGYASHTPTSTFTVYGLNDESGDSWDSETLTWKTFPGNGPHNTLSSDRWHPLGQFRIEYGCFDGVVRIEGDRLAEFVRKDTNGLVTFAIACDTEATEMFGLVFGFANKFHQTLMPPRLQLFFTP